MNNTAKSRYMYITNILTDSDIDLYVESCCRQAVGNIILYASHIASWASIVVLHQLCSKTRARQLDLYNNATDISSTHILLMCLAINRTHF